MESLEYPVLIVVVAILSIPVYACLAKIFFGERLADFRAALRFVITPDIVSMARGEYWNDQWESFKFYLFIGTCVVWIASVSEIIVDVFF